MPERYLESFLWRGRPPGHPMPSDWQVEIGSYVMDGGEPIVTKIEAMTPKAAADLGFDIPAVVDRINADTLAERDLKTAELAATKGALDLSKGYAANLEKAREADAERIALLIARCKDNDLALEGAIKDLDLARTEADSLRAQIEHLNGEKNALSFRVFELEMALTSAPTPEPTPSSFEQEEQS